MMNHTLPDAEGNFFTCWEPSALKTRNLKLKPEAVRVFWFLVYALGAG